MALPRQLLPLLAVLVFAAACSVAAQPATAEAAPESTPGAGIKVSFRPSVAIVVGIFTMIFSLTFLLLMYAKFCHPSSTPLPAAIPIAPAPGNDAAAPPQGGVPKPVIESLPFFRFATLRGARQGMECSVCLARFDDADHLRLLPRCRHAFHLACVDRWLESNASCPLCRARVDADDASLGLKYPSSARIVFGEDGLSSGRFDDDAASGRDLLDIFVERVPSARFAGAAGPKQADEEAPARAPSPELDRHKHRIIVSDVVFKSRWSELNSAALIGLDTEMMRSMSSGRFSLPDSPEFNEAKLSTGATDEEVGGGAPSTRGETTERKRLLVDGRGGGWCSRSAAVDAVPAAASAASRMISSGVRSMSEIVSLPRLRGAARERLSEEENRRWLPIARRTARWFAGRARGEEEAEPGAAGVHVVAAHV
ncbi:putative RING-H2 finger protein ATL12 [Panicum miliaceum]|uniref:RING-type E3 ubiquitin transferase n=1 Tax=Panicum miliaceum TaxID=4540 RepID=A0A3L6RAL5_PANMI|nr:putative RING-H2 finger protein ATL12 [Panicum miliaceum]